MSIRSLTFQVVAMMAIPAFAAYHEHTVYDFTFSSFAREGVITLPTEGEARGEGYHLGEETETQEGATTIQTPVFDRAIDVGRLVDEEHLTGDATVRPIAYIPQEITLTSIAIVTPGTVAPETLILTLEGGKSPTLTLDRTKTPEAITLHGMWQGQGAVGTRSGFVHTYTVASGDTITLNPGTEHSTFTVSFKSNDEPGQAQNRTVYCVDGRPYLRIAGKAELQHHIFKIDAAVNADHSSVQSLKELLASDTAHTFVDDPNTVIVVEFEGEGGGISLDKEVLKSPIVFGSSVTPDKAHVHFPGTVKLESALTFRDGASQGGISIYGPTDTENYKAALWNPSAMLLRCDLTLRTALPPLKDSWFATHSTTIPAGRTFRIELEEEADANALPNLSFAAADSVLELALAGNSKSLPTKYTYLMEMQSGTLVFDQDVSLPSLTLGGKGLETTLILREGQEGQDRTYTFAGSRQLAGIVTQGDGVTLIQEGGKLTLGDASTDSAPFALGAADTAIEVRGGTMTCATALEAATEGTNTAITVAEGATLLLNGGLPAGAADTTATLDLTVAGTLQLNEDLAMTPALRRTLTLAGGTIESTRYYPDVVHVTCGDGGTSDGEGLLDIVGGGTLTGLLVVDAAAGQGDLALGADATLKTLRDFTGTVSGEGTLEAIEGALGDVTLGDTWLANATGKKLGDVLTGWTEDGTDYHGASDFAGTIGFTAGTADDQKKLDFTNLDELTSLGMAFRINNHQHIVMRLDQYADAVIRWPDNPEGITLTLIESGAYGGEAEIPVVPAGVTFAFQYYDAAGQLQTRPEADYQREPSEDGVSDELTWENAVFTGQGAWIDVEFDGTSANTGWFNLGKQNGCLVGVEGQPDYGAVTANDGFFVAMGHPVSKGMTLGYRPYVAESALPSFPEEWSLAVRMTAPSAENKCILAIGNNYANATASTYSLVFATGAVETDGTTEIVLWKFDGKADGAAQPAQDLPEKAIHELFRVKVADAQRAPHVFSVVCDGATLNLYMDGAWLNAIDVPAQTTLSGGLQLGQQLGGSRVSASARNHAGDVNVLDGGAVDYIRFYKGAFPEVAMVEVADRTPYVRENLRYVRYVPIDTAPDGFTKEIPAGGETWRQDGAWQAETWDAATSTWKPTGEAVDEPAEGAYLRLLVDEGDHALQVNVERRVETTENGETTNAGCYFYSPNRNYAALVVEPQSGNAAAGTLRLVPYGVNPAGAGFADKTGDALTQAVDDAVPGSAWFTTTAGLSDANNTGFQYGKLRFTGGAYDPITDGDPTATNFYGSAYLLGGTTVTVSGDSVPTDDDWNAIYRPGASASGVSGSSGIRTATIRQNVTLTYTANPNQAVRLIFDGGVSYFSKYADMVVNAATSGKQTRTDTWTRTIGWTRSWDWYHYVYTYNDTWDGPATVSTGTPTGELTEQAQVNTLQAVAGMALTRGESAEVMDWQLTGPVLAEGTVNDDTVRGNPKAGEDQKSLDVWTVGFGSNSTWKFFDDTRIEAHGGKGNANGALGAGLTGETAPRGGLFARGVQTPGRLYLDFTATDGPATYKDTQVFSAQAWYRYGYEGNKTASTNANMVPERASGTDYDQAVAFQIRLSSTVGNEVTLTIDRIPKSLVQTFYVEEEAGATKALTLKLERDKGVEALKVWKSVVAAARLDVSNNNTGVATATSWEGNALNLRPAEGIRTPVHRGNATHGHGAFIVGATEVDWDFGSASSVPRLEVIPGAELTFTVGQDFRRQDIGGITLVAQGKAESTFPVEGSDAGPTDADLTSAAWIHHRSAAPFLGQDVELGEGAIFGFHAEAASSNADVQNEGVVLAGELRLTGNATLRADFESASGGAGAARLPHFVAAGGIRATKSGLTLIVDAPTHQSADGQGGTGDWHCHTATLTGEGGFGLWKTGPGTVTFYANTPPSVTGKVTVEEGTLAVTAATDTPIGAKGLHVKKGATLADSGRMSGTSRRVARIPAGQFLSGGGTVKGILRLESGATYRAKQGEALTADGISVDASLEADITIDLPDGTSEGEAAYEEGTPYLIANREERDVRRRLLPKKGGEWWDAIAWIDTGAATATATAATTSYAARPPQFPAPTDYEGYKPGTSDATIGGILEDSLVSQYRNAGHAYVGATSGRTRAGNKKLNNVELSDALLCFTNISAFVDDAGAADGRVYVDGTNFYVGYEFGISRQALVTIGDTKYVVLEVSVESVFDDGVSFPGVGFSEAQKAFEANFNGKTVLSFKVLDAQGIAEPLDASIPVEAVTGMDGATLAGAGAAATPGKRWFRIPLAELRKAAPDGNIRLRASATNKVELPAQSSEAL